MRYYVYMLEGFTTQVVDIYDTEAEAINDVEELLSQGIDAWYEERLRRSA